MASGGRVTTIGAFYIDCEGVHGWREVAVACAGATMDVVPALIGWTLWRTVKGDPARLVWWHVAVGKGFVASGYLLFSGVSGVGDFGTGPGGGLVSLPAHGVIRVVLIAIGGLTYWWLCMAAARALAAMLGQGPETRTTRRSVAHLYYATIGLASVVVGLFNPVGFFITVMSAAASSFGGNAGLIPIGYMTAATGTPRTFTVARSWPILVLGVIVILAFGAVLGPSSIPDQPNRRPGSRNDPFHLHGLENSENVPISASNKGSLKVTP